ncbi:hypothetical protein IC220_02610 [Wolbachia endosymbiont of Pentalonia nigronervosa]|uniref:hypothetical protein n=1 Tax=Wolbachia endosymbiont of Pentalonia nigronervosa TaxID=1301914 RepID=UPI00165EDE43|nr:hypothetical protein [Wolbachia endosymbiont of Pentalonia nigronervosa]MBD0391350.1 hypothetical protein [Wolbachia endosymbiont of Pentalonia nigronervosa]
MSTKSFSNDVQSFGEGFAEGFKQGINEVEKAYESAFSSIASWFKGNIKSAQPSQLSKPIYNTEHPEVSKPINIQFSDTSHLVDDTDQHVHDIAPRSFFDLYPEIYSCDEYGQPMYYDSTSDDYNISDLPDGTIIDRTSIGGNMPIGFRLPSDQASEDSISPGEYEDNSFRGPHAASTDVWI